MARQLKIDKALPWLPQQLKQMQQAMDNCADVPSAIRTILIGVYQIGYRDGAMEAIFDGEKNGRTKQAPIAAE